MKLKKLVSLFLVAVMSFCFSQPVSAALKSMKIPATEYERGVWYGFLPKELSGKPANTVVTWKQYCAMLGNMINKYDPKKLSKWNSMTVKAPNTKMKRDGAAIANLFAAQVMGIAECNTDPNYAYNEKYSWGEHYSWNYPIFDWNKKTPNVIYNTKDVNAIAPSYWFILGRVSAITGERLLSVKNGDPQLERNLTLNDAMLSTVRLYESVEAVALKTAEDILAETLKTQKARSIIAKADKRKNEILNTKTEIEKSDKYIQGKTYTGTAYYISNKGSDKADGKSPKTAWASLSRLKNVDLKFGDAIFFERGSLWRAEALPDSVVRTKGLTLSAYGTGEKPKFYGSPESGAGAEKWKLYYDKNGKKIWKFYKNMADCAAVILNGSTDNAKRIIRDLAYWDGKKFCDYDDITVTYDVKKQLKNMEVFTKLPLTSAPLDTGDGLSEEQRTGVRITLDKNGKPLKGTLYVRCDEGNPGALYNEIEFITPYPIADGMSDYTTLDNLCMEYYSRGSYGGYYDGVSVDHVTIQNCVCGWAGGSLNSISKKRNATYFGYAELAGGGFNLNGSYETIQNCYSHHIFQDGITLETFDDDPDPCVGVVIKDNVIEYAMYGLTIGSHELEKDPAHIIKDLTAENNYSLFCGFESLYPDVVLHSTKYKEDEGIHWPAQIGITILDNAAISVKRGGKNYKVKNNTFAFSVSNLMMLQRFDTDGKPTYEGNTYAALPGLSPATTLENDWGPLVIEKDINKIVKNILKDKKAKITDFTK